jgi:hypothetical protein
MALFTPSNSIASVVSLSPAVSLKTIGYPLKFNELSIISLVVPGKGDTFLI